MVTLFIIGKTITPIEFGYFVLGSSLSLLPTLLVGAGYYEAVLTRSIIGKSFSTAYWCSVLTGVLGTLLIIAGAIGTWLLKLDPVVTTVMAGLSIVPLLWSASQMHEAALIRSGEGAYLVVVTICSEVLGLLVLTIGAYSGYGVMALVAYRVTAAAVTVIVFFVLSPFSAAEGFDREFAFSNLPFGAGIAANRLIGWFDGYGMDLLLASVLPIRELGVFKMATRVHSSAYAVAVLAPNVVQNSSMGTAHERGATRMAAIMRRFLILHSALALPMFAGLAASAPLVLSLLLTPEWAGAQGVLIVLCLSAPFAILANAVNATYIATRDTRRLALFTLVSLFAGGAGLVAGASAGPTGAALGKAFIVGAVTLAFFANVNVLRGAPLWSAMRSMCSTIAACAVQFAAVHFLIAEIPAHTGAIGGIAYLVLANLAGACIYLAALRLTGPATFRLVSFLLIRSLLGSSPVVAQPPLDEPLAYAPPVRQAKRIRPLRWS
ncbi:MAG: oligosaccharide flippase family protein [Hyphomicrobium sp.]|nr:oligosaccharide flippase family protein [Hyphomicrobium sp.]